MQRLVLLVGLAITACGEIQPTGDDVSDVCAAGTHEEGGECIVDTTCLANTCNGNGTCEIAENATLCACNTGYGGANCEQCAAGFQDVGGICEEIVCGGLVCGAFGTCDANNTSCVCNSNMTGAECNTCGAPTDNGRLVWDTFGGPGQHHTIAISPGDTVVAMIPTLPTTQIVGNLSFAEVPNVPDGKYWVTFSRCPGDINELRTAQTQGQASPCGGYFFGRTGRIDWRETNGPNPFQCYLPPGDGPWYANIRVEPEYVQQCQDEVGTQCVINWQWN